MIDTIYVGGGTPSLIDGTTMKKLLDGLRQRWTMSDGTEITIEANPNSLTTKNLLAYRDAGINRLSIGVQSFDDRILSQIGRLHDAHGAKKAISMAKEAGFENINLDLMFGLPGQTLQQWKATLQTAVSLKPTHLSLYTLQIEEGTKLYLDYKAEKLPLMDSAVDRACYHYAIDFLVKQGYKQYEISNFAMDGYQCKHNMKYWSMGNFLGLGLKASSYMEGERWANLSDLDQWTAEISKRRLPVDKNSVQHDTIKDAMGIYLFTGLRKTKGISFSAFRRRFGMDFFEAYAENLEQLCQYRREGRLDWTETPEGSLWITEFGMDHSNEIMSEFV